MNIKCLFIGHEWSEWKSVKVFNVSGEPERLVRYCSICNKKNVYDGFVKRKDGKIFPYKN